MTPTATDVRAGKTAEHMLAKYGRSLTLRKITRQEATSGELTGTVVSSPLSTSALVLDGAVLAGASVVSLAALSVQGLLVEGDRLSIGGTAYPVADGPYAAEDNAIENVSLASPLLADADDAAPVTVSFTGSDTALKGFPTAIDLKLIDGVLTQAGDVQVLIACRPLRTIGIAIERGDQLLGLDANDPTRPGIVVKVQPIASGEQDAALYAFARLA